jgi:hypothetical protein
MDDIIALLELAVQQTLLLENSVSRNRTLGYLARSWADVYETGEIERRIEALEAMANETQPGSAG